LLLRYAAGALPEAPRLLVATHLAMDERARDVAQALEEIGGEMLAHETPAEISDQTLTRAMAQLDVPGDDVPAEPPASADPALAGLPRPLWPYLAGRPRWRRTLSGFEQIDLPVRERGYGACLIRFPAGKASVAHSHDGTEYTLVLSGSFTDSFGAFGPGDVAVRLRGDRHRPVADAECGCVCLAVTDAALTLIDPLGRLLNPLIRAHARRAGLKPH
jgi:putative transcriptional regulator